jgi:hypothetical protein
MMRHDRTNLKGKWRCVGGSGLRKIMKHQNTQFLPRIKTVDLPGMKKSIRVTNDATTLPLTNKQIRILCSSVIEIKVTEGMT